MGKKPPEFSIPLTDTHTNITTNMNYIDTSVLRALRANLFLSHFIHCHPFEWNEGTKLPQAVPSRWGIFHWHVNMCLVVANTGFVQFRSIQVLLEPESLTILCIYMQLMAFWYMVCSSMQLMFVGKRKHWERFIRNHMVLMEEIWDAIGNYNYENFLPHKAQCSAHLLFHKLVAESSSGRIAKLCEIIGLIFKLVILSFWVNTLFLSLNSILRPGSPEMLSSLVPNVDGAHWVITALFSTFHIYLNLIIEES